MPHYLCRLASDDGRILNETYFSSSVHECTKHFEEEGYCVLSVKKDWKKLQIKALPFEKKIKDKDFIMFNQELVALIKAGYPILKGLDTIIKRIKNVHLKEVLMVVRDDIQAGKSLSEAFSPYEEDFSTVYIASLMAGERSGNLAGTLTRYIDYAKVITRTKAKIKTAMTYPTLLLVFAIILLGVLVNFILPSFASFYTDFEATLPAITRVLMSLSLSLRKNMFLIIVLFIILGLVYSQMKKREKTKIFLDRSKLKTPYGGTIWIESAVALFSRTLSLLLSGGISLLSSVGIASKAVPNKYLFKKMGNLSADIKNGENLSDSLERTEFFPMLALDMIRIGESSANLEGMLTDVAEVYDDRISSKIDTFVTLIEPVIIIFMGLIVVSMLLAVYLPIFNIIKVTQ
jgi:type IV pilus assembly protein PilC